MVGFWINRASRSLVRYADSRLRACGFAMSYLPVLRALAAGPPLSQKQLAQVARVEQPTMVETLTRMERDGLVRREANPDDRRGKLVSLTKKSRARFPKAAAVLVEGEREAMAGLSESEKSLLCELLQRIVTNVERSQEVP